MTPKRVQMSRRHPWRAEHPDAVRIDRPRYGSNPYKVVRAGRGWTVEYPEGDPQHFGFWSLTKSGAAARAVDLFTERVLPGLDLSRFRGRDLACWCGLSDPCHGDPIIQAANRETP